MAKVLCVMGESGSGKTTSMRNLDPATTYYIDADKKGLSWRGWKTQYNAEHKNYFKTDVAETILKILQGINIGRPQIKTVVIDTINGIMVADEMRRIKEKNYDKWTDLAVSIYGLCDYALTMRDDMAVIFIAHTQTDREDSGYMFTHIKTSGKKLDKITVESKFPTVLLAKTIEGRHVFETKANNSTAKLPMGAIEEDVIDNDITIVLKALEDF